PRPANAVLREGGWTVAVCVYPTATDEDDPTLTDCERDCLTLLRRLDRPLTAERVCRELERQGIGVWAEITVKRALARLRKCGRVNNSRKRPRGYWLPDTLPPLFRQPHRPCQENLLDTELTYQTRQKG